jgi:protein-S-isoprenylcysteine O-methyltransferase Ste14
MWVVMLLGGGALGLWLDMHWAWARTLLLNPWWHLLTLPLGALLLWGVMRTSRYTGRLLARMGREGDDVPRMDTNKLVIADIYTCMRHPMHLGLMFFPLAIALILGSPTFIFIIAPLEMLMMVVLIKLIEEKEALAKFGDDYRAYMKTTPMFSLRPACIRKMLGEPLPRKRN